MGKIHKNERGFSAVEGILVLIIIVLVGVVGWFVFKNHKKTPVTNTSTSTTQTPAATVKTEPAKTIAYSNADLGVTLNYPESWGTATLADGSLYQYQSGGYKQLTFSKATGVNINFVTSVYSSPLDGCVDPVTSAQYSYRAKQASVIGWSGSNVKEYVRGQGLDGTTVYLVNNKAGDTGPGWTEISNKDKVLIYKDIDNASTRVKVSGPNESCGVSTQAQADEANVFLSYYHFAVNFSNTKAYGVNAQFEAGSNDNPTLRSQLTDTLNSLK